MITITEKPTKKCPGVTSLFVTFPFKRVLVDEIKLLPTVFYNDKTREWELPINGLAEFLDRVCAYEDFTLNLMDIQEKESVHYDIGPYKTEPFPHQLEAIQYGLNHDNWLLLDLPGLGKSMSMINLAKELKEKRGIEHCLIICGINSLKTNWLTEIHKHSDLSAVILGSRINRNGRLVVDGIQARLAHLKKPIEEFFIITNIETLRSKEIVEALRKNKYNKFDMCVLDEAHCVKNSQSAQGSALLKLNYFKYKIGLTGTLLLNSPFETYVPLKWIGMERSSFSNFKHYYGIFGGPFNNILNGYKNMPILKNQLSQCSLRRGKELLNLPPKTIINEYVDMTSKQEEFYENIKQGIIDQVDKVHMDTNSILGCIARFRQATVLPDILTTENIPSAKMDRAVDLAEQLIESGEKVVIFSTFKAPVYKIRDLLQKYPSVIGTGDQDDAALEEAKQTFQNDPECKLFIGTWSKSGTGITLNAASYMIFLDTPYTSGVYEQAQDRIHRIGTKNPVFIYHLITKNTVDERVLDILEDKKAISEYVIDDEITESGLESLRKYIQELI